MRAIRPVIIRDILTPSLLQIYLKYVHKQIISLGSVHQIKSTNLRTAFCGFLLRTLRIFKRNIPQIAWIQLFWVTCFQFLSTFPFTKSLNVPPLYSLKWRRLKCEASCEQRWEFIKENRKVRKNKESTLSTKKPTILSFFLIAFLVFSNINEATITIWISFQSYMLQSTFLRKARTWKT